MYRYMRYTKLKRCNTKNSGHIVASQNTFSNSINFCIKKYVYTQKRKNKRKKHLTNKNKNGIVYIY